MPSGVIQPQQKRSRATLARLLAATIGALEEHGLEGATIPRIARKAGVAPASVYRRFNGRDALIRAALTDALEKSAEATARSLSLESFKDRTLEGVVRGLVAIIVEQYRSQPGVMRSLTRFIENDSDEDFRSNALALVSRNYERIADLLLAFRDEVAHPNPRRAILFALLKIATIVEVRALERVSMWHQLMPISDSELQTELTRSAVAYLTSPPPRRVPKRRR